MKSFTYWRDEFLAGMALLLLAAGGLILLLIVQPFFWLAVIAYILVTNI